MGAAASLPKGKEPVRTPLKRRQSATPVAERQFATLGVRITKRLYEAIWEEARRDQRSFAAELRYICMDFLRRRQDARRAETQLR